MTDRELLEAAAKAAGLEVTTSRWNPGRICVRDINTFNEWQVWSPLTDDGDALRLAVKLRASVGRQPNGRTGADEVNVWTARLLACEPCGNDAASATRRAIVRAAAEIHREQTTKRG